MPVRLTKASYHGRARQPLQRSCRLLFVTTLAVFVTPHGFGHAARASAIMAAMHHRSPDVHFEIFTDVPRWFFSESLPPCFTYHRMACDVGLVQRSPLEEDLERTIARLEDSPVYDSDAIDRVARRLERLHCRLVIADIAPFGIAVAERLGTSSVLVENFTWDWIYSAYSGASEGLLHHARQLATVFAGANLRLQTEPVCSPVPTATLVPPVGRVPHSAKADVRHLLEIPQDDSMILLSMGGIRWDYGGLSELENQDQAWIVVPGGSRVARRRGRLILLPFHAGVFHPDLVFAADLVVGKLGYSTVAEIYLAGVAYGYIARPEFPESPVLKTWVEQHLTALEIDEDTFRRGDWLARVGPLLAVPHRPCERANGADTAAKVILDLL